jgi:UDP-N-acetylmuramoyl-L-alanyl-D-glutamate--2,6-diaminopimelate ligase
MKLKDLIKDLRPLNIKGDVDREITGVNIDSRRIENGQLFVAMK